MILLSVIEGQGQRGDAGVILPLPHVVQAVDKNHDPLAGLTLGFSVVEGDCQIATESTGTFASTCDVVTDADGKARIYLKLQGDTNRVACACLNAETVYAVAFTPADVVETLDPGGEAQYVQNLVSTELPLPNVLYGINEDTLDVYDECGYIASNFTDFTTLTLKWDTVDHKDLPIDAYFIVERCYANHDGQWVQRATTREKQFKDTHLLSNISYLYRIYTANSGSRTGWSNEFRYEVPLVKTVTLQEDDGRLRHTSGNFTYGPMPGNSIFCGYYMDDGQPDPYPQSGEMIFEFYPSYNSAAYRLAQINVDYNVPNTTYLDVPVSKTYTGFYEFGGDDNGYWTDSMCRAPYVRIQDSMGALEYGKYKPGGIVTSTPGAYIEVYNWEIYNSWSDWWTINSFTVELSWRGNGSEHFVLSYGGQTINNGDTVTISPYIGIFDARFPVRADMDLAQPGDEIIIDLKIINVLGNESVTEEVKFTYQGPEPDLSFNLDEACGARYRKIGLNGLPLADEKPQTADEGNQEKEESYIDALTLGLRHSTTDAYLPVSGADFAIAARRDYKPEIWDFRSGLRLHEDPARPFGACWTSSLLSYIEFIRDGNPDKSQPDRAVVTDENGGVHVFAILRQSVDGQMTESFFPMPSARNEQQTPNLESLKFEDGAYVFRRKYGSTSVYEMTTLELSPRNDRVMGSKYVTEHSYARLSFAQDRLGNQLTYEYDNTSNLVPKTIRCEGQQNVMLSIKQNQNGLVTDIWDANHNWTGYAYEHRDYGSDDSQIWLLKTVTTGGVITATYDYDLTNETDQRPVPAGDPGTLHWHAELNSITDANGNHFTVEYDWDHSKQDYMQNKDVYIGYYTKCGLPRNVKQVILPNGNKAQFENQSLIRLVTGSSGMELNGSRITRVINAEGDGRTYQFGDVVIYPLPQLRKLCGNSIMGTNMVCYRQIRVEYDGIGNQIFEFDPKAGMALSRAVDLSGNETVYEHADTWEASEEYRAVMGVMTGASFNGNYNDPTKETKTLVEN